MKFQRYIPAAAAAGGLLVALGVVAGTQLIRPYERPEHHDIDTSESAFLIPLEGDTGSQTAFPSVQFLEERKVAAKRVQIPHRWNQTGRLPGTGEWLATVRLIKVDRRPITREWTKQSHTGTAAHDQAVAAESRDSVNFSVGVALTANIPEESAAIFLYSYPSKSLAEMMDTEVRARVQQVIAEEAAKYDFTVLLGKKGEIMRAVKEDVVPFFKNRGINITTVGMLGGLSFENPEIQRAIDDAVKASQLKTVAEAKRDAQEVENRRIKLEAEARAEAAKLEARAKAEADGILAEGRARSRLRDAEAEADGLKKLAEARAFEADKAAGASEVYLRLRTLEAEAQRWKQWDGKFPAIFATSPNVRQAETFGLGVGGGVSPFGVLVPSPTAEVPVVGKK